MSEKKLQFEIVNWFWNNRPLERGALFALMNETTTGASKKGIGLVKGASDLAYHMADGTFAAIELKKPNSRHNLAHVKRQLQFCKDVRNRGGIGFFCFSLEHFQHFIKSTVNGKATDHTRKIGNDSLGLMEVNIIAAERKGTKTVKLEYIT